MDPRYVSLRNRGVPPARPGEFAPLREWLGEAVPPPGPKYFPQETPSPPTRSTIAAQPYLEHPPPQHTQPQTP